MTFAVLGAGGGLGRLVVAELERRGHEVRAIARGEARDPIAIAAGSPRAILNCAGASVALAPGHGWRGYGAVDVPIGLAAVAAARQCGARLIYIGVHHAPALRGTPYVAAHEQVAAAMTAIDGCIVRSTGWYSAFAALLPLARRGWLFDVGDGRARTNPIAELDLATIVVDAALADRAPREIAAGGPEVMTRRELFEQVAAVSGRRVRMIGAPRWLARVGSAILRPLHPRISQFAAFACGLAAHDVIGPAAGTQRFSDYLDQVVRRFAPDRRRILPAAPNN